MILRSPIQAKGLIQRMQNPSCAMIRARQSLCRMCPGS